MEAFQDIVFGDADVNTTELKAHLWRAAVQHTFSDTLKGNLSAFYGDYDKLYQNFYASSYSQDASPDVVTLDGYVDTTTRENTILSGNLVGELEAGGLEHTLLAGVEFISTKSNQDRWNTFGTPLKTTTRYSQYREIWVCWVAPELTRWVTSRRIDSTKILTTTPAFRLTSPRFITGRD